MIDMAIHMGALALTGLLITEPIDQQQSEHVLAKLTEAQAEREAQRQERVESRYEEGQRALEEARWQRAVDQFSLVAQAKGARSDAALYWKAYALDKLGQKAEALATTAELIKGYPSSKWMSDARALEIQVRQSVGQPVRPETEADEELKLLALQGLQHSDPEQAVPMLEKILQGTQSPRMKERALFVLAQSNSPRARQVLTNIARGGSNPDLQRQAIQYLGVHGGRENRELLAQIYASSTDVDVKRRILRAFGVSGEKARVLTAATTETTPELRAEAVRQLRAKGLDDAVREAIAGGRPYLGLCLGLQLLFEESEEHGVCPGLGLLRGRVERFPARGADGRPLRVPHIGWNRVRFEGGHPLLSDLPEADEYYFVHAYRAVPADPAVVVGVADHGGEFAAAVARDNLFAVQFHPEKSQSAGKRVLDAWRARLS